MTMDLPNAPQRAILVLDDQVGTVGNMQQHSFLRNYQRLPYVFLFEDCGEGGHYSVERAVLAVESNPEVELVLLDLKFGHDDDFGFLILRAVAQRYRHIPVLVMSHMDRDVESLGRCLEEGALGFVMKNRSAEYLQQTIEQTIGLMQSHVLLGQSPSMRELRRQAARLSPYPDISVLIFGEPGTGKERVGRYIWQSGSRSRSAFVHIDCANLNEEQLETNLFGNGEPLESSALARANHGILFLDEVEHLSPRLQTRLLRAVQRKSEPPRPGERVSLQILSTTRGNPEILVQEGKLLEEFYDLLAAVKIETPALRRCASDVPILANHFLQRLSEGKKIFADEAVRQLVAYTWPGNIRELQRVVQEAVVRSEDAGLVCLKDLPERILNVRAVLAFQGETARHPGDKNGEVEPKLNSPWVRQRLLAELRIAIDVKDRVKTYKGGQWRAEFMRCLYPNYKAQNAKGLKDVIKRFTHGPWGDPSWESDPEIRRLIRELES